MSNIQDTLKEKMKAKQFLEEHNIAEKFAKEYGITWDTNYLYIPIKDADGKLLWNKPRNLHYKEEGHPLAKEAKYKNASGSNTDTLFNWHNVKNMPNIILTEGEADAIKLTEEGIPAVSSSGGAGTFNKLWVEMLAGKRLWICYDNDDAGRAGVRKLFEHFPDAKSIELPEGVKDICDFFFLTGTKQDFIKLGKESLGSVEWHAKHRSPDYNLISSEEFSTMEIEQHPWLIENVVYSEGFCFIYGAEGTGKSYLTLDMAIAIASGTPWLGKFPTVKANVLFLDKENPKSMIQKRLKGLGSAHDNIYWLEYPEKYELTDFNGEASAFARELTAIIAEKDIELLIIDSFVDLVNGSENSSADTQMFFNGIRELYPQIAYVVLHHENKPSQGISRSSSQRLRGSSNINTQTFTMFRIEAVAKSKTEMTLQQTKARDSQKLNKFMLRMKVKPALIGGTTVTGFEYVGEVEESAESDPSKVDDIRESILNTIEEKGFITRKEILLLGKKSTADRAVKSLAESGEITGRMEGGQKIYTLDMFSKEDFEETLEILSKPLV